MRHIFKVFLLIAAILSKVRGEHFRLGGKIGGENLPNLGSRRQNQTSFLLPKKFLSF